MSRPMSSITKAREEKLKRQTEIAELDLAERRRELINRAEAERVIEGRARYERDAWLDWASATAPLLAAEMGGEPGAVFAALDKAVRDHLGALADTPFDLAKIGPSRRPGRPKKGMK